MWNDNQAAVDQYWQRHLLQLGYADKLLGRLVARLKATGLYDRSLLVVTADEGLSFRAGEKRRPASAENLQDISYVPLFMKLPHERRGRVVRRATRSADILPTIAAALKVTLPWPVEGQNQLAPSHQERFVSWPRTTAGGWSSPRPSWRPATKRPSGASWRSSARTSPSRSSMRSGPTAGCSVTRSREAGASPTSTRSTVRERLFR